MLATNPSAGRLCWSSGDGHDLRTSEFRQLHEDLLARVVIMPESSPFRVSTFQGNLQIRGADRRVRHARA